MIGRLARGNRYTLLASLLLILTLLATACGASGDGRVIPADAGKTPVASSGGPAAVTAAVPAPGDSLQVSPCPPAGAATALTGAGATFPGPLYTRWFDEYNKLCSVKVNYQAIGSGGGIQQFSKKTVDFGASDGLLTDRQKATAPGALMIPMTSGPVAVVVNLPGIGAGQLKLTPDALSGIYLGTITKWNDLAIAAANAGLTLPNQAIAVIRRSDGSGTTNIFTSYLSELSAEWKSRVGAGNSVQWPAGLGGEGNAGVAGLVKQIPGSIGYVEVTYAAQNKMAWVALQNRAGAFVEPTLAAATAAAEGIDIPASTEVMITNSASPEAYPIVGFTWIIVYENQANAAKAQTLAHMLWWAIHDGQKYANDLGYPVLSPTVVEKAEALIRSIKVNGQPVLP